MAGRRGYRSIAGHAWCDLVPVEHQRDGLVSKQLARALEHVEQMVAQRSQPPCRTSRPVGQRRAVEFDALARVDLRLPVQRQMVGIFGHQHVRDKRLAGQATVDDVGRCRRLYERCLAAPAAIARATGDEDAEGGRYHVEPLGNVLADDVQRASAAAACLVLDVDDLLDPLQVRRKATTIGLAPARLAWGDRHGIQAGGDHRECRLGILERHLQLLVVQLLRAGTKTVPTQRGDDVVQPGQLRLGMVVDGAEPHNLGSCIRLGRMQGSNLSPVLLVGGTQRGNLLIVRPQLCHGRDQHGAQTLRVGWKVTLDQHRGAVNQAALAASTGQLRRHGLAAAMDPAPIRALQQHRHLRGRETDHAVADTWSAEAAQLEPFCHQAQARAVPPHQLHPVRLIRPEDVYHAGERVGAVLCLHQRRQRVRAVAEVHWRGRHHDPRVAAGTDQRDTFKASITAAMTPASAPRPIFTATPSISSSTTPSTCACRARRRGGRIGTTAAGIGSITAGTNTGPAASRALRASRRQVNSCDGRSPWRLATALTLSKPA